MLQDGKALLLGGLEYDCFGGCPSNGVELYDPATGTWTGTGNLNFAGGGGGNPMLLLSGKVLVFGGKSELYDPTTGTWSITANINTSRVGSSSTLLSNGKILVAGGNVSGGPGTLNTAELYDPGANPNQIDDAQFFITQQYIDFLRRLPEPSCPQNLPDRCGLDFYLPILNGCQPSDIEYIKYTRGALSANFFRSPEFQAKGAYVMYLYMISIGQRPVTPAELSDSSKIDRPHYAEFMADVESITSPDDRMGPDPAKKTALTNAWMLRPEIQALYPAAPTMTNDQFVQKLLDTAGVTDSQQAQLVADLNNNVKTRADVLRIIAESPEVNAKFYKPAFVTMEYFGYLRRDPEDCHNSQNWFGTNDPNACGYIFHNNRFQLVADPDFLENTIVRGFIESPEYCQRFGP